LQLVLKLLRLGGHG